jgi:hypothetical protein
MGLNHFRTFSIGPLAFPKISVRVLAPMMWDSASGSTYIVYGSFSTSLPSSNSFQYVCRSSCAGDWTGDWTLGRRDNDGDVNSGLVGVDARRLVRRSLYCNNKGSKSRRVKLFGLLSTWLLNRSPRICDPVHF